MDTPDAPIHAATLSDEAVAPTEIRVTAEGRLMRLTWPGGVESVLTGARLRAACRCAHCLAAARRGKPVVAPPDVAVRDVRPCGTNAVNIAFSDGHERGIYPFGYLAAVAAQGGDSEPA